jgi:thiol-disulfide isomerase/thioredoxin
MHAGTARAFVRGRNLTWDSSTKAIVKWILATAGALIVAIVLKQYFPSSNPQTMQIAIAGKMAPSFAVPSIDGKRKSLAAYRGRVIVMNLWATWCPPCRAEMPDLERLYETYRARGLVVIGINQGESRQRAAAFAQSLRIRYPIWLDDQQQYGRTYIAIGLPTTVIIDRSGAAVPPGFDGPLTYAQMKAAIAPLVRAHQ